MKAAPIFRIALAIMALAAASSAQHPPRQMERLDRGVVAVNTGKGVFVSWRLLGTEPGDLAFDVYRATDGGPTERLNDKPLTGPTHFVDTTADGTRTNTYTVHPTGGGGDALPSSFTVPANAPARPYLSIKLKTPDGYQPNDASVGDLDGDGAYEIVLHQAGRSKDNSHDGVTDPPILQAYRLDGEMLWQINLGPNIREGAHYTQFMVYDLDGDGRSELVVKTADGSTDGQGNVIGNAGVSHVDARGRVLRGPEYLSVFDGRTGAVIDTTGYIPLRGITTHSPTAAQMKALWGDGYGNRADRFLACVAYLDGVRPSVVMCRGYYTRTFLVAWDLRDGALVKRWVFDSDSPPNAGYGGQGNHQLAVADVDGDGRDEIIYGAMAVDDDGTGLHTTKLGHGDALHASDLDPTRPGLEVFGPLEKVKTNGNVGTAFRDARTGEVLWSTPGERDVGRGMAADIDPRHAGCELWATNNGNLYSARGEVIGKRPGSVNFGIWWDGDLLRELLDKRGEKNHWHGAVYKWDWQQQVEKLIWEDAQTRSNNTTKGTPALSGDILGDWREEMIWRSADGGELRVYTTTIPTTHRFYTLMHDPTYRLGIAWQNVAYNQPPHPGFFLGHGMAPPPRPAITLVRSRRRPADR